MVYALADKYDCKGLKVLALQKFGKAVPAATKKGTILPVEAIRLVYSTTPESDRGLRDICVQLWAFVGTWLKAGKVSRDAVQALLRNVPDLAADLAMQLANTGASETDIIECDCHETEIRLPDMLEHNFKATAVRDRNITAEYPANLTFFWC